MSYRVLNLAGGICAALWLFATATGTEISFDYIGANQLAAKTSGSFAITGVGAISGTATISSSTLTLALNDVVRGSATVRLAT